MDGNQTDNTNIVENLTQETPQEQPKPEKDRTQEQFEKLVESNKTLKEERDQYKNVLESLKPNFTEDNAHSVPSSRDFTHLSQDQVDDVYKSMVDEDGYLDGNKLTKALKEMDDRARAAELRAAQVEAHLKRREVAEQESMKTEEARKVHEKFPQLDPESTEFDEDYYQMVRNEVIGQMMDGKEDFMGAAQKWYDKFYKEKSMKNEEKTQQEKKQEQKAQINAIRPRSSVMAGYYSNTEEQSLVTDAQKGKKGAVAELLRRRGQ